MEQLVNLVKIAKNIKQLEKKKYYFVSNDKKAYVELSSGVDLEWLKINLGKEFTEIKEKPKKIHYQVLEPEFKEHWVFSC